MDLPMIRDRLSFIFAGIFIAVLPCIGADVQAFSPSCQTLHDAYKKNGPDRVISVYGHERSLSVYWDGSAPSRAAAALLLVTLRHGLRYRLLDMTSSTSSLCTLQEERDQMRNEGNWPNYKLITAPSFAWNESAASECNMGKSSERLQVLSTGAAPPNWDHNHNSDAIQTVKVADVSVLRNFAPSVLEVFGQFWLNPNVIQELIDMETNDKVNVTEAACTWALNNSKTFDEWLRIKRNRTYEVVVFQCRDDPDSRLNKTFLNKSLVFARQSASANNTIKTKLRRLYVDCADEYALMKKFMERIHSVYFPRLIGAVACGAGTRPAANVASAFYTPLVLYDVATDSNEKKGLLQSGTRSATGKLDHLVIAFRYFFSTLQWTRISIISEGTTLASNFVKFLQSDEELSILDVSMKKDAKTALHTLSKHDARIIFINADADVTVSILCEAYKLRMLGDASFVWILREWRSEDLVCGNSTISGDDIFHFTISFWWRGGDHSVLNLEPSQVKIHRELNELWNGNAWPQQTAPLIDAITMLIRGFYNFLERQPQSIDDLHNEHNYRAFWQSYDSEPPLGSTQKLNLNESTLSHPNIYITKWRGKQQELKAIWQITNDSVKILHQPQPFFDNMAPLDGHKSCWTMKTGDKFLPRCHDSASFTALAAILIAIPAALLARHARQEHIVRRDRELKARLLARGRRASAALAAHLVDRATLQLGRMLGEGKFGRVYLATLRPPGKQPLVVAAKMLRNEATQTQEREFLNEAVTLASLNHNHVVRLIGVCATGGPPLVLMEHAFFGDLLQYLHDRRHLVRGDGEVTQEAEQVSAPALTRLAQQAATALDYLRQQRFVHRDVRASNCLVDARRSLKLADFGLARKMESGAIGGDEEYLCRRHGLLPVLWMAPESLQRGVFTAASDAWALGVLLLELATLGVRPYGCWLPELVIRYVSNGGYPPMPMDITPELRRLLLQCWRREPAERASAAEIARELTRSPTALRPALKTPALKECCPYEDFDQLYESEMVEQ